MFNNLILISKWLFKLKISFFGFWNALFEVQFVKDPFNINLVEVQIHTILISSICDNNLDHCNVLSPS
jgi:hypothetical protein